MAVPDRMHAHGPADFRTTHWSVVLAANQPQSQLREVALSALCQTYWYPLYAFVRRHGRNHHEAEDLTQDFFHRLLAKEGLASVRREKGRFRAFLLASMKNFLLNDIDRKRAAKRGGNCVVFSFDDPSAEERYRCEPWHDASPEKLFEKSWAQTLLNLVYEQLRRDHVDAGRVSLFDALQLYLVCDPDADGTYAQIAERLGMTEGAVKMARQRLVEDYRVRLRAEIAHTVTDVTELESELRHLFASVGR